VLAICRESWLFIEHAHPTKKALPPLPQTPSQPQKDKGYDSVARLRPWSRRSERPRDAPATTPATVVPTPEDDDSDDE